MFLLVRTGTALTMTAATAVERVFCKLYQKMGNRETSAYHVMLTQISLVAMAVVGFLFLVAALAFDVGCSGLA